MKLQKHRIHASLLAITLLAVSLFQLATHFRRPATEHRMQQSTSTVVIAAPIQALMYAGDRFLAANLEAMRVAAIGPRDEKSLADFRLRAHEQVSQLNACHEDNFYLSNAMLSWGGSVDEGNKILERATACRHWDDIPPFFLGFNRYFFYRDTEGAVEALDMAAERSRNNRPALQRMAIVIESRQFDDEKMAAAYLRGQRDEAKDKQLAEMLDRRLQRLEGLIALRDAQTRFEQKHGRALQSPNELLTSGIMQQFPQDPLRIGYEFIDGRFRMKAMKIGETEIR